MKMSEVDLLIESTITEAPLGMISHGVKKILGKLPGDIGDKATGQVQVGKFANQLKKDYSYFIGTGGYERSRESLKAFLDKSGLSTSELDNAIGSATSGSSSNQDWKIYPGRAPGGPVNRAIDPVVDIGSATDAPEVLPLDDRIAAAQQKRLDATTRTQQQAKADNKPAPRVKPTGTTYSAADIAANNATNAAVSSANTPSYKTPSPQEQPVQPTDASVDNTPIITPTPKKTTPKTKVKAVGNTANPDNLANVVKKQSELASDQLELPVNDEEPTPTSAIASPNSDQDAIKKAEADAEAEVDNKRRAFDLAKRDNPNLKSLYLDNKNGYMGRLNIAIKALAKLKGEEPELETKPKPVSLTSTTDDVIKKAKAKPKSNAKSKSENTDVKKTSDELIAAVNAYNKDQSNEELALKAQQARVRYQNALKAAEAEDNETDDAGNSGGLGSELNRFAKASEQVAKDKENDKKTNDAEQKAKDKALKAYNSALVKMNTGKQTKSKQEKLDKTIEDLVNLGISEEDAAAEIKKQLATVSDSIEHEFDFILTEDELTNKEVDKILLAIAQDNVRKNIVDLRRPTATKKSAPPSSGRSSNIPNYSNSSSASQYNQPRQQPSVGSKTLDLSDFRVKELRLSITKLLNKQTIDYREENQIKRLISELKAINEARAIQANMLAEAPMGLGKRLATGVASKFSSQAAGKLDVGKIANQYKPEYSRWVGSTGSAPDAQSLIDFFQSKRLDTSKIQSIADSVEPGATRLNSQQIDNIIMQITQDNIRKGVISTSGSQQAGTSTQSNTPTAQSTLPVMAQRMLTDPAVQSHPEYVRFLSGLK